MILDEFYSKKNINVLKNILQHDLKKKNIQNFSKLDIYLNKSMNYVKQNVSNTPPKNMNKDKYLFLLNKKVYELVMPLYKNNSTIQSNNQEINNTKVKNESKTVQNNLFDPDILKNYKTEDTVIEYPKPASLTNKNVDNNFDKLQEERKLLYPKVKEVNFNLDTKEDNKANTVELYNDLLNTYNSQVGSLESFENSQKNMNQVVDQYAENIEDFQYSNSEINKLTPINQLNQNNNENKNNTNDSIENFQNFLKMNNNEISKDNQQLNEQFKSQPPSIQSIQPKIEQDSKIFSNVQTSNANILLKEPDYQQILKTDSIVIDSRFRNLELFPNQCEFIIKFNPNDNNFIFKTYKDANDITLIRQKKIVIGNYSDNDIGETFDNIEKVVCKAVTVPTHSYEYVGIIDNTISTDDFGLTLFKDSYLLLEIPELRSPYRGGTKQIKNSYAMLRIDHGSNLQNLNLSSNFANLVVSDETMIYKPVTLGKLDKFTLKLNNKNGRIYNFGIDKLYIQNFSKGELKYLGSCGKKAYSTKFEIQRTNDEYIKYCKTFYNLDGCNIISDNPLQIRDLLYFYKTIPNEDESVFFEKNVKVNQVNFNGKYTDIKLIYNDNEKEYFVNFVDLFRSFMTTTENYSDYYLVIIENGTKYNFKVFDVDETFISVENFTNFPNFLDLDILIVGLTKANRSGIFDENIDSLFNINGYNVISIKNTNDTKNNLGKFIVEIDYPYANLPYYLKNNLFNKDDLFFIQDKKQISYVFSITYHVKDYNQLDSYLNESGNN